LKGSLLIIDDDEVFCRLLQRRFEEEYAVTGFSDPEDAVRHMKEGSVDVVLTDFSMPKMDGMEILKLVKSGSPDTDVIIMTAYANVETAVEAMKKGAYDYIIKPFSLDELSIHLGNLFEKRRLHKENINLRNFIGARYLPENIVGESKALKEVRRFIKRVSQTDATVLITGETGTGKELVARAIHFSGKRNGQKFVSVHCAELPEGTMEGELPGHGESVPPSVSERIRGLFEEAHGGTLVLREIGDMNPVLQAKLLGILENRTPGRDHDATGMPFDVMVIATTNKDLARLQREGKFREDLFFRLSMFTVRIPPLRERKEDIPLLAEYFFSQYKNEFEKPSLQISWQALEVLKNYDWPGNVRELKSLFAKVCLLADSAVIRPRHLLERLPKPQKELASYLDSGQSLEDIEKNLITETLKRAKGNMTTASRLLNISYDTLRYRMKKFGINPRPYKE